MTFKVLWLTYLKQDQTSISVNEVKGALLAPLNQNLFNSFKVAFLQQIIFYLRNGKKLQYLKHSIIFKNS